MMGQCLSTMPLVLEGVGDMSGQMAEQLCLLTAWACMTRGSVCPYT